jgi:hypothetical protein
MTRIQQQVAAPPATCCGSGDWAYRNDGHARSFWIGTLSSLGIQATVLARDALVVPFDTPQNRND